MISTCSTWIPHPDVLAAHLDGETILLHLGSKRYFRLNCTGSVVWQGVEQGLDANAITARALAEFDAPDDIVAAGVSRVLQEMERLDLLHPAPADE